MRQEKIKCNARERKRVNEHSMKSGEKEWQIRATLGHILSMQVTIFIQASKMRQKVISMWMVFFKTLKDKSNHQWHLYHLAYELKPLKVFIFDECTRKEEGQQENSGRQISFIRVSQQGSLRVISSLHLIQRLWSSHLNARWKNNGKKNNDTKSKRYRYVRGLDVEKIINLSLAVKRSCHWADWITQGDPVAMALFVLSV